MKIEQVTRFIEKELRKKIQREVRPSPKKLPKITNERDLESSIYFHLRDKIRKERNFKIATNFSVHGYKKEGTSDKSQMMPDIVVLEWINDFEKPKIKLMMELKIMEPWKSLDTNKDGFKNIIKNQDGFLSDFRKLNYAIRKKWTEYGYFVFLYHSPKITQRTVEHLIKKQVEVGKKKMRFKPIAINKFEKKISNKKIATKGMIKSCHKAQQLYSSRPKPNDDPHELWATCQKCGKLEKTHTPRDYNRCNPSAKGKKRSSSKGSMIARKAVRTRKRRAAIAKEKRSAAARKAVRTRKRRAAIAKAKR